MDFMEEERRRALLNLDCEKSVGVILEFIKEIEVLQNFVDRGQYQMGVQMAQVCCKNPIINKDIKLPTVGLITVQNMILDGIMQLDPAFRHSPEQGIYNIAADGNCSYIVDICNRAIDQLYAARL